MNQDKLSMINSFLAVADTVLPSPIAIAHRKTLQSYGKVDMVVYCDLYNGLLDGEPIDAPPVNPEIFAFLKALESQGREINILFAGFTRYAAEALRKISGTENWKLKHRFEITTELANRGIGETWPAEFFISNAPMALDKSATVTLLKPADFKPF